MAQIAGRAGRHQRDGTFGTLAGPNGNNGGSHGATFADDEVYAIEEHRFPPLTRLFWREAEPRFDTLDRLIADLETPPSLPQLAPAPEAIDLAVLKRLAEDPAIAETVRSPQAVARFWEACRLPDFRQQGAETHARFVARLWEDLRGGMLGGDYVASAIAQLDNMSGDIDMLQHRIASIRSWAYIAQRPDWVLARDEMAARARAVEARLSDALHARLTERFVNRRTAVLMKKLGADAGMLPVRLEEDEVLVDGEHIGTLSGFRFVVDPSARHADRKLVLAAAERHVPALLAGRAEVLAGSMTDETLTLRQRAIYWDGQVLARLKPGRALLSPQFVLDPTSESLPPAARKTLAAAVERWLGKALEPLEPLRRLEVATIAREAGPELRALLIRLVEAGGMIVRAKSGIDRLDKGQRAMLARLRVRVGALDLFVPAMLRPAALTVWREIGGDIGPPRDVMPAALAAAGRVPPPGYRALGKHWLRIDMAEKLLRDAHAARIAAGRKPFLLDPAKAVSMGLTAESHARLLRLAGFQPRVPRPLPEGAHGPAAPPTWRWRPPRRQDEPEHTAPPRSTGAFAALAELVR
jgi:ATP-dependent RNA helicase SUPV3L1/SUV3